MVCKAILNAGLALCLVLQAMAPCCCAFQSTPSADVAGVREHRCHDHPASVPVDSPSSDCGTCSVLGQVYGLPLCAQELPSSGMPEASLFELDPPIEPRGPAVLAACPCDAITLRDLHEMQTLRE